MADKAHSEKVKILYNSMAETYDEIEADAFYVNQYKVYSANINSHISYLRGRVLDLGCGTGIQTIFLAQYAQEVVGVDLSPKLLAKATLKCKDRANVKLLEADATELPFESGYFDTVISYGETISHIQNYRQAFNEACRVLKPGGLFIFSVLNKWNLGLFFSPVELLSALRAKGGHWRVWRCEDDAGRPTALELKTFTRPEIVALGESAGFYLCGAEGIHISSLLIPLWMKRSKQYLAGRSFSALGRFDLKFASNNIFSNAGYTCLYSARRK